MDFSLSRNLAHDLERFEAFLNIHLVPNLSSWNREREVPRGFFEELGRSAWLEYCFPAERGGQGALKQGLLFERLARTSPGVAVAVLVHVSLGLNALVLFGSDAQKERFLPQGLAGKTLMCTGSTEHTGGSDVAGIAARAEKVPDGWMLNGTKAYVTNGALSDLAVVSALTDPEASRTKRLSLFLVDLNSPGVSRTKLGKQVWIPSDLTRLEFSNVHIPEENLLGVRGRGLQQILEIFTHSRISIAALTLGTAAGAFSLALEHAKRRTLFGTKVVDFQAKSFEIADLYAKIEAAALLVWKDCWLKDQGREFRRAVSAAKYLAVAIAREVGTWAADIFGAPSVMLEHPIHKFPMDAWAASLGEGTQDVQKLVIFREIMKDGKAVPTGWELD
ncbi:MAG TPA: acyl-CoA dehydrogenase family protein [Syntrophobacteria bacterium]|nr:acyl-CoA dehydrogenase family protein [Syntrophobacteria bacterium]